MHEAVGLRGRRCGVHANTRGVDPKHLLTKVAEHEQVVRAFHVHLQRPVAVEDAHVEPCGRGREPQPVVDRDRRRARMRPGLGRRRERGRCQRDECDPHYALSVKVAFSLLTRTTTL